MTNASTDDVELLSFRLDDQEYCVEITSVREIRGWTGATPLPHAPAHVKGVINLRGTVLPVIDLAARLGMAPIEEGEGRKVVVVVQDGGDAAGLLVDAVSDILTIPAAALRPPPALGDANAAAFIRALTLLGEELLRVLDLGAVLPRGPSAA